MVLDAHLSVRPLTCAAVPTLQLFAWESKAPPRLAREPVRPHAGFLGRRRLHQPHAENETKSVIILCPLDHPMHGRVSVDPLHAAGVPPQWCSRGVFAADELVAAIAYGGASLHLETFWHLGNIHRGEVYEVVAFHVVTLPLGGWNVVGPYGVRLRADEPSATEKILGVLMFVSDCPEAQRAPENPHPFALPSPDREPRLVRYTHAFVQTAGNAGRNHDEHQRMDLHRFQL
mmetsp:Transcript_31866/g.88074  ORF Transcript_31866/g.88074 Transcript_31866/m.88074 type:complete len:231 (+) Transcript_31866:167-859(+)